MEKSYSCSQSDVILFGSYNLFYVLELKGLVVVVVGGCYLQLVDH